MSAKHFLLFSWVCYDFAVELILGERSVMFGSVEDADLVCQELRQVCDFADWYVLDGVLMVGYMFDFASDEEHHATVQEALEAAGVIA